MRRSLLWLVFPLLVAGCGNAAPDAEPTRDRTPVVRGPNEVVLRTMTEGGIAGLGGKGAMPDVSVYGSGLVVAGDGRGSSRWPTEYRLTRPAYDRLVSDARKAGLGTPRTIDDPQVSDAFHTVITFAADAAPKTTRVIERDGRGGAAAAFAARLDPKTWPAGDLAAEPKPYAPAALAVLSQEAPAGSESSPWPFGTLGSGEPVGSRDCTILTGADITKAQRLAGQATGSTAWQDQGRVYRVEFRPLLPDEPDCGALARS